MKYKFPLSAQKVWWTRKNIKRRNLFRKIFSDESQKEELQTYEEVVSGVKAKIYSLFTATLKKFLQTME